MNFNFKEMINRYKFCFRCGGKLKYKKNKKFICSSCKKSTYINPLVANGSILKNDLGEIMLVKRAIPPKRGYWDLPGGFIDPGETAEDSVIRELKEELGIKVSIFKYFGSEHDVYKYEGIVWPTLALVFTGSIDETKVKPQDDVSEVRFFKKDEIPYDKIAFDGVKRAIKKFTKKQ